MVHWLREVMTSALRPLERYTLYSKVSIHEAQNEALAALHDQIHDKDKITD